MLLLVDRFTQSVAQIVSLPVLISEVLTVFTCSFCLSNQSGVIAVGNDYYFLEPGHGTASVSEGSAHTISKTTQRAPGQQSCSTHNTSRNRDRSRRSGRGSSSLKRRRRLATSLEYFLEVAVVTEPTMLRTHHYQDLEAYVFTLMNIVSNHCITIVILLYLID